MSDPLVNVMAHAQLHDSSLGHTSLALTDKTHCAHLKKLVAMLISMPSF